MQIKTKNNSALVEVQMRSRSDIDEFVNQKYKIDFT